MATTVGGVTNTAQMAALPQDVQSAITDGLNRLAAFRSLPDNGGTMDIVDYYGAATVDAWKAPYATELNDLANRQPPLTAAEAKTEVDDIMSRFAEKAMFMRLFRKFIFMSMMKIVQRTRNMFDANGNFNFNNF